MADLCEDGIEPAGSLKAIWKTRVKNSGLPQGNTEVERKLRGIQSGIGTRIRCRLVNKASAREEETIPRGMPLELDGSCEQYGKKIIAKKTKDIVIGRKLKK
ncbi:hypothetical protein ANN_24381 [Periplaneta americana]|uniref:Uncharacterized protein n=1 Tax=Periplaneta americana TaxID=6978 RepID=A0ABQ8S399_PERAM|nr:hypothetical protein ANN_24381 [Periplaneta americana]